VVKVTHVARHAHFLRYIEADFMCKKPAPLYLASISLIVIDNAAYKHVRRPFEKFVDSPYNTESKFVGVR
jgi:hypothetical protein